MPNLVPQGIYCVGIPAPLLAHGMTELSHSELRVLLYIYLHTLGYQKSEDSLTYNQIVGGITTREGKRLDNGAGVSRRSLVEALAGLEKKGYIKRTGANSASSKIALRFDAPEFENSVEETTNNQIREQQEQVKPNDTGKNQQVQKLRLLGVQKVHSSYNNNHALKHDDEKMRSDSDNQTQITQINPDYIPAVNYLLQNIPNLAKSDAEQLVSVALVKNARTLIYLQQLTQYVLSNKKIHTPAAVLTRLIKNNSERIVAPVRAVKFTQFRVSQKEIKNNTTQYKTFPFASKYVAHKPMPIESNTQTPSESLIESSTTAKGTNPRKLQIKLSKLQANQQATGFVQTTFAWDELNEHATRNSELTGLILPVSRVTGVESEAESDVVLTSIPQLLPVTEKLEEAIVRLRDDVGGRLRYSASRQLIDLLQKARLEVCQDSMVNSIKLDFGDEISERLLTQQDFYVVRLSLRQSLGMQCIIKIGESDKDKLTIKQVLTQQAS